MTERQTDTRLRQMASRLKLSFIRDHLAELLDTVVAAQMSPREQLQFILGKEIEQRDANRFRQALMAAHFPMTRTLEDFDFAKQPSINRGTVRDLEKLEWIDAGENVALFGPPGVGKTHLAIGIGYRALEHGYSVRFYTAGALLALLEKASKEGTLDAKMKELNKPHLLIVDEIGYLPYTPEAARLFFMLVSRRYEHKSLITTSNRPPSEWGLIFADAVAATAILDRLLHHCTVLTILGESYRLLEQKKKGLRVTASSAAAVAAAEDD